MGRVRRSVTPVTGTFSGRITLATFNYTVIGINVTFDLSDSTTYTISENPFTELYSGDIPTPPGDYDEVLGGATDVQVFQGSDQLRFSFSDPVTGPFIGATMDAGSFVLYSPNGPYALTGNHWDGGGRDS